MTTIDEAKAAKARLGRIRRAILSGAIVRSTTCETCSLDPGHGSDGRSRMHACPVDGSILAVRWLCNDCHRAEQARARGGALTGYGIPRQELTAGLLRSIVGYDPATGAMTWLISPGPRAPIGSKAGRLNGGYLHVKIMGRSYSVHRLAWLYVHGRWPVPSLDHRDGNPCNNAIANLREATPQQQSANKRKPRSNTSGFKGVGWNRSKQCWFATIKRDGKQVNLGYFDSPEVAHAAYFRAAVEIYGEFARAA